MKKVEKKGLQGAIQDLRARGYSYRQIADVLRKQGQDVSHMAAKRYLDSDAEIKRDVISKREELQEKLVQQQLDIYQQLIDAHRVVKGKIEELANTTEHSALVNYAKELRNQVELMSRLLGQLSPLPQIEINQTFIENNLTQVVDSLPEAKVDKLMDSIRGSGKLACRWHVLSNQELLGLLRQNQEDVWFEEQKMEEEGDRLVLNKPKPEVLDDLRRWKQNQEKRLLK